MLLIELESPFDLRAAQDADKKFRRKSSDLRPVFRRLLRHTLPDETVLAIRTQGASMGEKWPPLDADTIAARPRRAGKKPLIRFGDLLRRAKQGRRTYKKRLTSKELIFGPRDFRDVIAMSGSNRGHVPTRNPVGWNMRIEQKAGEAMIEKLEMDITEYLGGITSRTARRASAASRRSARIAANRARAARFGG